MAKRLLGRKARRQPMDATDRIAHGLASLLRDREHAQAVLERSVLAWVVGECESAVRGWERKRRGALTRAMRDDIVLHVDEVRDAARRKLARIDRVLSRHAKHLERVIREVDASEDSAALDGLLGRASKALKGDDTETTVARLRDVAMLEGKMVSRESAEDVLASEEVADARHGTEKRHAEGWRKAVTIAAAKLVDAAPSTLEKRVTAVRSGKAQRGKRPRK